MLLAIDTATRMAGLALYDEAGGRVLGEQTWYSNDHHTVELMPRLAALIADQGLAPGALTGLVVSLGPGSFTGLRTGISLAKGLALARGLPLVGVPTLEVTARPHYGQRLPIWAVLQAGRGRVCAACFTRHRGRWRHEPYLLTTVEALCEHVEGPAFFCGEIGRDEVDLLRERLGADNVVAAGPAGTLRRPAYLAEIGWERLAAGDSDDPVTLSPIYLHNPPIDG